MNEDQIHSTLPIMRRRIINSVAWEKLLALLRPILSFVQKLNLVEKLYEAIKMSAKFLKADEDKLLPKVSRSYFKVLRLAVPLKYFQKL